MTSERWRHAWGLFRDVLVTIIGAFLLVYEAVRLGGNGSPRAELIGAGLLCIGAPAALRADKALRSAVAKAAEKVKENRDGDTEPSA